MIFQSEFGFKFYENVILIFLKEFKLNRFWFVYFRVTSGNEWSMKPAKNILKQSHARCITDIEIIFMVYYS